MKKVKSIVIAVTLILVTMLAYGCTKDNSQDVKTPVLTVDDSKIYLNEVMYHVILEEMQGELYASFLNDTDFWNKEDENGVTMGKLMKQQAMDNAIKYELLYQRALNEDFSLTKEEEDECKKKVDSILMTIKEEDIVSANLTAEKLLEIQEKITLSTRYYDENYKNKGIEHETAYDMLKENHKIKINEKIWNQIVLGK